MNLRTLLIGLFAATFGILAALGVYLLNDAPSPSPEHLETDIVVLSQDVVRGSTLDAEHLATQPWPKQFLPKGAITNLEDAVGRTVWIPMLKDEPVIENKLAARHAGRGVAALIPPGMRAITIQTPNVSTGVAGLVLPGNRVDVLLTLSRVGPADMTGGAGTVTLLQNIEILAVDQRLEAPSDNMIDPKELRSVTLLVTPEQAGSLDLGKNKGTLSLSLRNPEDNTISEIEPATLAGLQLQRILSLISESETPVEEMEQRSLDVSQAAPPTGGQAVLPEFIETAEGYVDPHAQSVNRSLYPVRTLRGSSRGIVYLPAR